MVFARCVLGLGKLLQTIGSSIDNAGYRLAEWAEPEYGQPSETSRIIQEAFTREYEAEVHAAYAKAGAKLRGSE